MRPTIVVPSPTDTRYGFLSPSSRHAFNIEGKIWPTVTHFMIAKQFEGTMLEEEVRKTDSVTLAKSMARPRSIIVDNDERVIKKIVYGSNKNYEMRSDWKNTSVQLEYLRIATSAKFDQNSRLRRKLIDTKGMKIEDPNNKNNESILETLRDAYILEIEKKKEPPKDVFKSLSPTECMDLKIKSEYDDLVTSFFSIVRFIKDLEGVGRYYVGMFEDAITNLVPLSLGEELIEKMELWVDFIFQGWSTIAKSMPSFEALVRTLKNRVDSVSFEGLDNVENLRVAVLIASFVRWLNFDAKPDTVEMIIKNSSTIKKKTVFIPAKPRPYRKTIPLFVSKNDKSKKGNLISFKGVSKFDRVSMTESKGKIFVSGKDSKVYETRLLELGGRRKGDVIELPLSAKSEVESLFYDSQPDYDQRVNAIYRAWCQKKVDLIMDMAAQISHLVSKPPGLRIYKIVARMCGIHRNADIQGLPCPADAKTILDASKIPSKIQNFLFHPLTPLTFPKKGSFEEICAGWDKECGWKGVHSTPLVSRSFTKDQCYVIKSITNIVNIATLPGKGLGYPHTMEVVVWAFLTLTPKDLRKDAEKYIKLVLGDYDVNLGSEKATAHLKKSKINYNLEEFRDYMENSGMGKVPVYMLIVLAAALSFTSRREQEFRYRTIILKGIDRKKVIEIETCYDQEPEKCDFDPAKKTTKDQKDDEDTKILDIPPKGTIEEINGDILKFKDATWILTIANASSKAPFIPKTKSEMITSAIYKKYAYANVYNSPAPRKTGTAIISMPKDPSLGMIFASTTKHRYVATLVADHSEGGAKKIEDTEANRKLWFSQSLESLQETIKKGEHIAISKECLAEGYEDIFKTFVEKFCYESYVVSPQQKKKHSQIKKDDYDTEKVNDTEKEQRSEEEINRSVLYTKLFKPHNLSEESHKKLVRHLERCMPKIREAWLLKFMEATLSDQKIEIDSITE